MKLFIKRIVVLLLVVAQLLPVCEIPAAHAADKIDSKIRFNDFYGEVKIRPDAEEDDSYEFVDLDTVIYEGDRIKTEEDSGAILGLEDMSTYVIKPDSTLIIHTDEGNVSKIEMLAGSMWGNIKKMSEGKSLEVEMSQCVCGINGSTVKMKVVKKNDNTKVIKKAVPGKTVNKYNFNKNKKQLKKSGFKGKVKKAGYNQNSNKKTVNLDNSKEVQLKTFSVTKTESVEKKEVVKIEAGRQSTQQKSIDLAKAKTITKAENEAKSKTHVKTPKQPSLVTNFEKRIKTSPETKLSKELEERENIKLNVDKAQIVANSDLAKKQTVNQDVIMNRVAGKTPELAGHNQSNNQDDQQQIGDDNDNNVGNDGDDDYDYDDNNVGDGNDNNDGDDGEFVDQVTVTKGHCVITNNSNNSVTQLSAGQQAVIDGKGNVNVTDVDIEAEQNDLNEDLNNMNDKQSTDQLIDKLNDQTGQINQTKNGVDNAITTIKKAVEGNTSSEMIKQAASLYNKTVEEGKRFVSIFVEVNSCISVLSQRIADKSTSQADKDAASEAINNANAAMTNFSLSLDALTAYADTIEEKLGTQDQDSSTLMAEKAKEIKDAIESANKELDEDIVKSITDESSYSDFKNAITRCEALLKDIQNLSQNIKADEVGTASAEALTKQYEILAGKIEKAIKDYSSVPEVNNASLTQMNVFAKDVPGFSSDIRKYLKEYKAIENSSTDAKKRYVESATRTLASYDRMRRVYAKANRMYTQMEKEFKQSKFKTSEYNDVKESWENIEKAMTEIDNEASELSTCVEDLKNQLEGLLGQ